MNSHESRAVLRGALDLCRHVLENVHVRLDEAPRVERAIDRASTALAKTKDSGIFDRPWEHR